jgi:hypothetical protein
MTTGLPEQIVALFTVMLGVVFTDTVEIILLDTQPLVLVAITE